METLPTATPRHSTFFSWYLTVERISLICEAREGAGGGWVGGGVGLGGGGGELAGRGGEAAA